MSFESLGLHDVLVKAVTAAGYTAATPVQAQAIPMMLEGVDLMVSAATGSGKTAAFMLPALQKLMADAPVKSIGPRVLVLTPTRELALQVTKAAETYGRTLKRLRVVSVVGGMPYPAQIRLLKQPVDVLVATPGRLLDYIGRGRIDFSRLELLVLDEADRMLDMGFIEDIEAIAAALPTTRQTVMFSATFGGAVGKLAEEMLNEPQRIELATHRDTHESIEQRLHFADDERHKSKLLQHLLQGDDVQQAIIFTATKRDTETIADALSIQGFAAAHLHGDMPQAKRNRTLTALRRGDVRVLVATDVAARGIDVPNISHVINYGMPMRAEDYVHRIGRTGRAGKNGIAITIAAPAERHKVRAIERFTTQRIAVHEIAGLEPKFKPEARERRPRPEGERRFGKPAGGFRPGENRGEGRPPRSFGNSDAPKRFNDGERAASPVREDAWGKRAAPRTDLARAPRPAPASRDDNWGNRAAPAPRRDDNWGNRPAKPAGEGFRGARPAESQPRTAGSGEGWGARSARPATDRPREGWGTRGRTKS